jgi:hypothetical protein
VNEEAPRKAFAKPGYWVVGTAIAFVGVLCARVVPGVFGEGMKPIVTTVGIVLAIAGLFVITLGTRKKN